VDLLGTQPDEDVAQRTGRTVRCKRCELRIEKAKRRGWGLKSR
jgi:hypothetical protein